MARQLHKLNARQIETLRKPGRHSDGGGLYLRIFPNGSKSWGFLYERKNANGRRKQTELGLGSAEGANAVSLAIARQKAADFRKLLMEGKDPKSYRHAAARDKAAASITFGEFADEYVETHRAGWSNAKHAAQWAMTLGSAYCNAIRDKYIGEIDVNDVLAVLQPVWHEKPETARRIRMRLERVLDAAKVRGLRESENPARWRGHLDHLLPRHLKSSKRHHPAMPYKQVPTFMAELANRNAISASALELCILTATRTSETLNATWEEIDLGAAMWTISAERMKARRPHRVPLSNEAVAVLRRVEGLHPDLVFPGQSGRKPLSNMTFLMLLRRMGQKNVTAHGFRSSFRDWTAECTLFSSEVAEMALAHVVQSATEAAYRRGDLLEKRWELMAAWGDYCFPNEDKIKLVGVVR